ncbi:uncharacterized protein LOC108161137 [Drosophila miranda]|uniref:uncharacterized protein LOC108161137 n=1 Tax=Drosophila miranda TaxID=7229 RepID=UPI0007E6A482|nr:uncharacterized protein LOC108161137 [Drosophila miranda]
MPLHHSALPSPFVDLCNECLQSTMNHLKLKMSLLLFCNEKPGAVAEHYLWTSQGKMEQTEDRARVLTTVTALCSPSGNYTTSERLTPEETSLLFNDPSSE